MNTHQKSNLAKLTIALLENFSKDIEKRNVFIFDMGTFFNVDNTPYDPYVASGHQCGTSCCFLGYAGKVFPKIAQKHGVWGDLSFELFGFHYDSLEYQLLFRDEWPNDPLEAACRALMLLEDQKLDERWIDSHWRGRHACYFNRGQNADQLIEKLRLHVEDSA